MDSEGPYKIDIPDEYKGTSDYISPRLVGPGLGRWGSPEISDLMATEKDLNWLVYVANTIHAAGRKAECERCIDILKKYPDDGKEIGDRLEAIRLEIKGLI